MINITCEKKKMNHQTALLFNGALSASSVFFINGHLFKQFSLMKTNLLTNGEEEIAITFLKMK